MTNYVDIRQAGRSIAVDEGVTILEAAFAEGIAYPHGCRPGRCGSRKSRLASGEVDLLDHSSSHADQCGTWLRPADLHADVFFTPDAVSSSR